MCCQLLKLQAETTSKGKKADLKMHNASLENLRSSVDASTFRGRWDYSNRLTDTVAAFTMPENVSSAEASTKDASKTATTVTSPLQSTGGEVLVYCDFAENLEIPVLNLNEEDDSSSDGYCVNNPNYYLTFSRMVDQFKGTWNALGKEAN